MQKRCISCEKRCKLRSFLLTLQQFSEEWVKEITSSTKPQLKNNIKKKDIFLICFSRLVFK